MNPRQSTSTFQSLLLALLIVCFLGSGCGGGDSPSSEIESPLPAKTLRWSPPASYTDDTPLTPVTDLDRFEIYVNESGAFGDADTPMALVSAIDPATGQVSTSFNLANLGPYISKGVQYHVSLRAVALTGLKSGYSQSASFSF